MSDEQFVRITLWVVVIGIVILLLDGLARRLDRLEDAAFEGQSQAAGTPTEQP